MRPYIKLFWPLVTITTATIILLQHCWLGVRTSIQPVKNECWGAGMVICLEQGANDLHMVKLMPMPPYHLSSFASSKSRMVLPFWRRLTQTVLENHHHNHFMALFPGPPGWDGARRELLDFMVQGKINRGRHIDHPAGCHSIRSNQFLPPPFPHIFTGQMPSCRPTNSTKALKATSKFGLGRRC